MKNRRRLSKFYQSQVNVLSKLPTNHVFFLWGIFLALFLVIFFLSFLLYRHSFSSSAKTEKDVPVEQVDSSYQRILDANLEKLQDLQKEATAIKKQYLIPEPVKNSQSMPIYSPARIRAATRVYSRSLSPNPTSSREASEEAAQFPLQSQDQTEQGHRVFIEATPYAKFANHQSALVQARAVVMPHPEETVAQGELIEAVLETPIRSDLPGMVRAVVATPVYSYLGNRLLIPKGSRLIGQYASFAFQAVSRVMVVWQRVILPSGLSVLIDSPGVDELGRSGLLATHVDTHFLQRLRQACFVSLFRAPLLKSTGDPLLDEESFRSVERAIQKAFPSSLFLKTTLLIDQGTRFNVFVARDLDFFDAFLKRKVEVTHGI